MGWEMEQRPGLTAVVITTVVLTVTMMISVGLAVGEWYPEDTKKILSCMGVR